MVKKKEEHKKWCQSRPVECDNTCCSANKKKKKGGK